MYRRRYRAIARVEISQSEPHGHPGQRPAVRQHRPGQRVRACGVVVYPVARWVHVVYMGAWVCTWVHMGAFRARIDLLLGYALSLALVLAQHAHDSENTPNTRKYPKYH